MSADQKEIAGIAVIARNRPDRKGKPYRRSTLIPLIRKLPECKNCRRLYSGHWMARAGWKMGSRETRLCWVAGSAGLAALSGVAITTLFLPFSIMLMLGAAVAARWPRAGRWLMRIGAAVLSAFLLPSFVVLLREFRFKYVGLNILMIDIGWIGTLILLPICDVMLAMDRTVIGQLGIE